MPVEGERAGIGVVVGMGVGAVGSGLVVGVIVGIGEGSWEECWRIDFGAEVGGCRGLEEMGCRFRRRSCGQGRIAVLKSGGASLADLLRSCACAGASGGRWSTVAVVKECLAGLARAKGALLTALGCRVWRVLPQMWREECALQLVA